MRLSPGVRRRLGALLIGLTTLGTLTPPLAYAIGCLDEQTIQLTAPQFAGIDEYGDITSGFMVGVGTKTGTGLLYDTYSFTAIDIVSGQEYVGSYQVSTFACLTQRITGGPIPGTATDIQPVIQS